MIKEKNFFIYGVLFLLIQISAIIRNLPENYIYFLWFCDFAPLLYSISFFLKKSNWVKSIVNFGLIPQFFFLLDFFYVLFTRESLFGIIPNLFELNFFYTLSTLLIHLSSVLAFILTYKEKPQKLNYFYSIILIFFVYLLTLIFSSSNENFNYVYINFLPFTIPYYTFFWPILAFLLLILPTQLFQEFIYKKLNK